MADALTAERVTTRDERPETEPPVVRPFPVLRWLPWLAIAAVAIPFVAVVVVAITHPWLPASDTALIELHTYDTGTSATPLLGPFSRLGWNHPGPLMFWVLSIPYRLLGASDRGMLLGAILVNATAVAGSLWLAFRRGGTWLALALGLGVAALIRGTGAAFLVHTWNPDIPVLPLLFLVMAVWSLIEGDLGVLPAAVLACCFAWQSHLGYLPVAVYLLAVGVAAAGVTLWRARRGTGSGGDRLPVVLAAVVLVLCLAPVLYQQLTGSPGNLTVIGDSFRHPTDPVVGLRAGLGIAARHLSPVGTWVSGDEPTDAFNGALVGAPVVSLLIPAVAAVTAALLAWRARAWLPLRFLALTASTALVGAVAAARTTGHPYPYLFNWFRVLALALWLAIGYAVVQGLAVVLADVWRRRPAGIAATDAGSPRPGSPRRTVAIAVLPVLAVVVIAAATATLSITSLSTNLGLTLPDAWQSDALARVVPPTLEATAHDPRVFLRIEGECGREVGDGMGVQLVKHGTEVVVPEAFGVGYGMHRTGPPPGREVRVVCGAGALRAVQTSPTPPVVTQGVLTPDEAGEVTALREQLRARVHAAGRDDLLPATDSGLIILVALKGLPGLDFAGINLQRYGELLDAQAHSLAVFVSTSA